MCEIFRVEPDDPFFEKMEPLKKLWWYESWAHKIELEFEKERSLGILIGSFSNPEMADRMIQKEKPVFVSSDEDFEESIRMIEEAKKNEEEKPANERKRRKLKRKILRG